MILTTKVTTRNISPVSFPKVAPKLEQPAMLVASIRNAIYSERYKQLDDKQSSALKELMSSVMAKYQLSLVTDNPHDDSFKRFATFLAITYKETDPTIILNDLSRIHSVLTEEPVAQRIRPRIRQSSYGRMFRAVATSAVLAAVLANCFTDIETLSRVWPANSPQKVEQVVPTVTPGTPLIAEPVAQAKAPEPPKPTVKQAHATTKPASKQAPKSAPIIITPTSEESRAAAQEAPKAIGTGTISLSSLVFTSVKSSVPDKKAPIQEKPEELAINHTFEGAEGVVHVENKDEPKAVKIEMLSRAEIAGVVNHIITAEHEGYRSSPHTLVAYAEAPPVDSTFSMREESDRNRASVESQRAVERYGRACALGNCAWAGLKPLYEAPDPFAKQ